jgi:hypothetical protein
MQMTRLETFIEIDEVLCSRPCSSHFGRQEPRIGNQTLQSLWTTRERTYKTVLNVKLLPTPAADSCSRVLHPLHETWIVLLGCQ